MLETSNILVNKLSLTIRKSPNVPEQRNISDIVKSLIYHQICNCLQTHIDWHTFIWGGTFTSSDSNVNGISAYARTSDDTIVWASSIYVKDKFMSRRRWKYYFGIHQNSNNELSLSYAKCYYDHMAGSISTPKPVHLTRDQIPDVFFFSPTIQCMCGKQPYSNLALELNSSTLQDFVDCVQDETRSKPVILITCADYITPEPLMDRFMGNAVIYWCDDASMIMRLNKVLPENMSTPWDCLHVFIPLSSPTAYHPIYTYDEIYRMGKQEFISRLIQAYCRSMHHEERKSFITIDDVNAIKGRTLAAQLTAQRDAHATEITDLSEQLKQQTLITQALTDELNQLKDKPYDVMIAEYEEMLAETMSEVDNLKKGISTLSEQLFSTMGIGFMPDNNQPIALLQELSQAIYSALACAKARK